MLGHRANSNTNKVMYRETKGKEVQCTGFDLNALLSWDSLTANDIELELPSFYLLWLSFRNFTILSKTFFYWNCWIRLGLWHVANL